jgi:hypothetical protein
MKITRLSGITITLFVFFFSFSYGQMTHIDVTADQSLRTAIEFCAANNVDSIILTTSGGVYAEPDTFTYQISEPLTIVAKEGLAEKPIIVNTNSSFDDIILEIFRVSDDFVLKGVVLDGGYEGSRGMKYGIRVGPDYFTAEPAKVGLNITVEDVDFIDFLEAGTGQGHALYFLKDVFAGTVKFENCTVTNTGYEAIRMGETEKYACTRCLDTLIIRNVTFENVPAEVIRFYADLDTATQDAYLLFENLTVNRCNTRMAFIKNNKNTIMRNVIITNDFDGMPITGQDRKDYIMDVQSPGSLVSHIDTFNVLPVAVKSTKGGRVDTLTIYGFDPMYADEANGDYTLLSGSPAYNAGYNNTHLGDLRWAVNAPVNVEDKNPVIADNYTLNQNYPNPFNPATTISFYLPKESRVVIDVYNVIGQKVNELINTNLSSGEHKISFDGSKLQSGVYFYTIKTKEFSETRKMVLLK